MIPCFFLFKQEKVCCLKDTSFLQNVILAFQEARTKASCYCLNGVMGTGTINRGDLPHQNIFLRTPFKKELL
jgi:hypothetical protein